jgi:hydrogenase maturation protease
LFKLLSSGGNYATLLISFISQSPPEVRPKLKEQTAISQQTTLTEAMWLTELESIFHASLCCAGKVVLVGMGHPLRRDDYAGSYIVKKLKSAANGPLPDAFYIFDGEDNVEALITEISELAADHVVFVDACEMKAEPGETQLVSIERTSYPFFTTHGIPLKLIANQLLPKSNVWLLAIQPKDTNFGEELTPGIRRVCNSIVNSILGIMKVSSTN